MSPNVTVIVPVFNVAAYIEKCARSIFEQSLENLEILFIDDCTPDNSVEIIKKTLEQYPSRKDLTRIISLSANAGQAGVRRRGIIEATGDYVIHCDGDDWIDRTLYEKLYNHALSTSADVVVCDEVMEYSDRQILKPTAPLPTSGKALLKEWYRNTIGLFCHNKLVRRNILIDNDILPWQGLNMWEDNGLFARIFYYADKVAQIHGEPFYHYNRANQGAMTAGYGIRQVEQMIEIARRLADFFNVKPDGKEFRKTALAFQYLAKINLITDSFSNYRRFKKLFPESDRIASELDPGAFSTKGRIRFNIVKFGLAPLFILMFKAKSFFID